MLDGITGGVTSIAAEQITFHTITPLADAGGYEITAQVRSKYFDPKDRGELRKSIVLKADNQDFILKPIYNVSRPDGEPLFDYLLELAMPDGTIHTGTRGSRSDSLRVLIGTRAARTIARQAPRQGARATAMISWLTMAVVDAAQRRPSQRPDLRQPRTAGSLAGLSR